jgi:hypothetical protein
MEMRYAYRIFVGKPEGKRPLKDIVADGKVIPNLLLCVRA